MPNGVNGWKPDHRGIKPPVEQRVAGGKLLIGNRRESPRTISQWDSAGNAPRGASGGGVPIISASRAHRLYPTIRTAGPPPRMPSNDPASPAAAHTAASGS